MIIYKSSKVEFLAKVNTKIIADAVKTEYEKRIGKVNIAEYHAWQNSLRCIGSIIDTDEIQSDTTICIEYKIPNRSSRIDFIIAGKDRDDKENVVIVELKQWNDANPVEGKDLVSTFINGSCREVVHPSYQAWSYALTLKEYNEVVQKDNILLFPCAYLHNYAPLRNDAILDETRFKEIGESPVFTNQDALKLREFIVSHVSGPDTGDIMTRIDYGKIKPSKSLQDVLGRMLKGNQEFVLIDEQKTIYEDIMHHIYRMDGSSDKKTVFIVEGGPGTGKSVIAINLLAKIVQDGKSAAYVTKNAAPRAVYKYKLEKDHFRKGYVNSLFLNSGNFVESKSNDYDVLIVDEAHRLNARSGLFANKGENQIKEIINASRISVFFIDEDQKVTAKDIGSTKEIKKYAGMFDAKVFFTKLISQFRCNGSDGYMDFLDDVLQIKQSYYTFDPNDYEIKVVDDPNVMMADIRRLNMIDNKARMLAGYCWNWVSKSNGGAYDIVLPEFGFEAQWNYNNTSTWAIDDDTIDQVGCIHTSQGLEFSYVGVIIGNDLRYENGKVITDYTKRAQTDQSLKGLIGPCNQGNIQALSEVDKIIRDTYKTLLSRAMKGCFIYCTDKALSDYLKTRIEKNREDCENFYRAGKVAHPGYS